RCRPVPSFLDEGDGGHGRIRRVPLIKQTDIRGEMSSPQPPAVAQRRSEPAITISQLREVGLFGALSDEFLEHLVGTLHTMRVMPGESVFKEGDPAREMYVVLDGEIEVLKRSRRGRETRVAILGPNDCFGEMS